MQAGDIIGRALQKINVKQRGFTLRSEDTSDGLDELISMIRSMPDITIPALTEASHTLVSGTGTYTIGSGGDIDVTWPYTLVSAFVKDDSGYDHPLKVLFDKKQYDSIKDKSLTSDYPRYIYYANTYPLGTFKINKVPTGGTLYYTTETVINDIADLTTEVTFPPYYDDFLIYNLAVRMAPNYEREASDTVKAIASMEMDKVSARNFPVSILELPSDLPGMSACGYYDINEGPDVT